MFILTVSHLSKTFGKKPNEFTAVNDISFELKEGEILGILGRNGAGKTTTIQMLLGILIPSKGTISYFGKDLFKNREEILEQVNFSSTYTHFPWRLTVEENLKYMSYLYDIKNRTERLKKVYDIFRLKDIWKKEIHELSAGQVTRVNLAKSFLNYPKVLLLDEPTASLDPEVAQYIRQFLLEEQKKFQVSIIITSHNMSEVEELCDRVVFIDQGKIIANDTPEKLTKSIEISHVELQIEDGLKRIIELCKNEGLTYRVDNRNIIVDVNELKIPDFLRNLMDRGIFYTEISIEKPTLEDYFLQATQK